MARMARDEMGDGSGGWGGWRGMRWMRSGMVGGGLGVGVSRIVMGVWVTFLLRDRIFGRGGFDWYFLLFDLVSVSILLLVR